jgi:hypothetical protein
VIRLLCCALLGLFLLNLGVFYHTFLSFSTPIFLSVALFLFEGVFTLLSLFHSSLVFSSVFDYFVNLEKQRGSCKTIVLQLPYYYQL